MYRSIWRRRRVNGHQATPGSFDLVGESITGQHEAADLVGQFAPRRERFDRWGRDGKCPPSRSTMNRSPRRTRSSTSESATARSRSSSFAAIGDPDVARDSSSGASASPSNRGPVALRGCPAGCPCAPAPGRRRPRRRKAGRRRRSRKRCGDGRGMGKRTGCQAARGDSSRWRVPVVARRFHPVAGMRRATSGSPLLPDRRPGSEARESS